MISVIADNITSPLGCCTSENLVALKSERSSLAGLTDAWGTRCRATVSLFPETIAAAMQADGLSRFEGFVANSAFEAISKAGIDITASDTLFVLSTTKGNIASLEQGTWSSRDYLGASAVRIAKALGVTTMPLVACNACISGLSALITAERLLSSGQYRYAIVSGADLVGKFVFTGFNSLKALSPDECRPFDMERQGLNLGEAAATIVLAREEEGTGCWKIRAAAVRNDAHHISTPAPDGEGLYLALRSVLEGVDTHGMAFVNAHGTATMFNDQSEAVAFGRAGLTDVQVNSLKGYYGHTLGAAGLVETIISMHAADIGIAPGTRGFRELGVSEKIRLSPHHQPVASRTFVKTLAGFGGGNAAVVMTRDNVAATSVKAVSLRTKSRVVITPAKAVINSVSLQLGSTGKELITELYMKEIGNYPRFYKMDMLSRLGFVASELLLQTESGRHFRKRHDRSVILFNRTSSIDADKHYWATVTDAGGAFPSPSWFVCTLPNIVVGEIAIRNGYCGETSFYILPFRDEEIMDKVLHASCRDSTVGSVLCGWLDYEDENHFSADLCLKEVLRQ
ncbi:MAG: 3-oxoacyl-ACP synthase [Bacteroidaceae bacterium]|nr:3-oxoacyl-ACP synthase [Bacteroidaceae bacterium]